MSDPTSLKPYYAEINGQQVGPFPVLEMRAKFKAGEIDAATSVWCEGMADWTRFDAVDELKSTGGTAGLRRPPPSRPPQGMAASNLNSFNWYAFFFNVLWIGYKGMWDTFWSWVLPFTFGMAVLQALMVSGASLIGPVGVLVVALVFVVTSLAWPVLLGRNANRLFLEHQKMNPNPNKSVLRAAGAFALYLFIFSVISGFARVGMIAAGGRPTRANTRSTASVKRAAPAPAPAPEAAAVAPPTAAVPPVPPTAGATDLSVHYSAANLALADGEGAIGKTLLLSGTFGGLQNAEAQPAMVVMSAEGKSVWHVVQIDGVKNRLAQTQPGAVVQMNCVITQIKVGLNVCALRSWAP